MSHMDYSYALVIIYHIPIELLCIHTENNIVTVYERRNLATITASRHSSRQRPEASFMQSVSSDIPTAGKVR